MKLKRYAEYKALSNQIAEKIPAHWDYKRLNEIANLRRGPFGGALKVDNFVSQGFAVYEQQHAIHKDLETIRYFIDLDKYNEMKAFEVRAKDILLSCSGTIGQSVIVPNSYKKGIINQALLRIRLKENRIDLNYFKFYIDSYFFQTMITDNSHGSAMKNIASMSIINKVPIALPPISEQERIVACLNNWLENIDSLILSKSLLIRLLEEKRQSMITEAVTKGLTPNVKMKDSGVEWIGEMPEHWNCSKFKYVGKLINGYAFPSTEFTTSGIRVMKITNIQSMNIDWSDESFIDETYYDKLPQFRVHKNDLVFALTRPIISSGIKAAIVNTEEKVLLNQRNALYRSGNSIISSWLYYIMLHKLFVQEFESYIDRTGQQPNISSTDIENIKIPVPTLEEQQQIVNYLNNECNSINNVIGKNKQLIEKLKEYRQSLIYEAVTGKIDVRDFEIEA